MAGLLDRLMSDEPPARIADAVRASPEAAGALVDALAFPDAGVRARAGAALERLSRQSAWLLGARTPDLIEMAREADDLAVRGNLARILPRLRFAPGEAERAADVLRGYLRTERRSIAVRAWALEGFARLAVRGAASVSEAAAFADAALAHGKPGEQAGARRARAFLAPLEEGGLEED